MGLGVGVWDHKNGPSQRLVNVKVMEYRKKLHKNNIEKDMTLVLTYLH